MGKQVIIVLSEQELARLQELKEQFGEKTNTKTIKKLLKCKIII